MADLPSSSGEGLTVTYDEDSLTITFDWDPETNPEYNVLESLTKKDLLQLLLNHFEGHDETTKGTQDEIHEGGQSSRKTEGNNNSESEK